MPKVYGDGQCPSSFEALSVNEMGIIHRQLQVLHAKRLLERRHFGFRDTCADLRQRPSDSTTVALRDRRYRVLSLATSDPLFLR